MFIESIVMKLKLLFMSENEVKKTIRTYKKTKIKEIDNVQGRSVVDFFVYDKVNYWLNCQTI